MSNFQTRHIGTWNQTEKNEMLKSIGLNSLDELIEKTVPNNIKLDNEINIENGISEFDLINHLRQIANENKVFKSFIGLGFYNTILPNVIRRNILENPGWYTQYTPYQAEISQGRLEALLNFQTMICDLTKMEIANASLLDEATSSAEAMLMAFNLVNKTNLNRKKFFVSEYIFPQTIDVIKTRAEALSIEIEIGNFEKINFDENYFGGIIQCPNSNGEILDNKNFIEKIHSIGGLAIGIYDLMSLCIIEPEKIFDIIVGSSQRFGIPFGFGGPNAAFFATKNDFIRQIPGRIIGVSVDANGNNAYRMTLQTREQHIRREKATSNICTSQALLAIISGMYAIYNGSDGLTNIAKKINHLTATLDNVLQQLGFKQLNKNYFDTLKIETEFVDKIKSIALKHQINFRYFDSENHIGISLDETTSLKDVFTIAKIFALAIEKSFEEKKITEFENKSLIGFERSGNILNHKIFNKYRSETELMRYIKKLENKDLSLTHSMIPLGSCTMKLNSASELIPISWQKFSDIHPFVPQNQAKGYLKIISELKKYLCQITEFDDVSFQPNSGAQGEYAGLLVIKKYLQDKKQFQRDTVLIPSSAHGTNPASAAIAGFKIIIVKCDAFGNIDIDDLKLKCSANKKNLAALMITYPSTHGVFEENIVEICEVIHKHSGQVYMDGANLNAQVGLTNPKKIGADICHINLHKTFAIPHGGGGPGMGPICVAKHLSKYLPTHTLVKVGGKKGISSVSSTPFGSASILIVSYAYIKMLGKEGLKNTTQFAILNANYLKNNLEKYFKVLYKGKNGTCAHEFILDFREFKKYNIEVEDIAKRLMDYGFHAPTVSFPVAGTLMIEPTESESKYELDKFILAMQSIHNEILEIANGVANKNDNVLKNSPHTEFETVNDNWKHSYTRTKAAFPVQYLKENKFWPSVGRINNLYGDKNLVCSCLPIEEYV